MVGVLQLNLRWNIFLHFYNTINSFNQDLNLKLHSTEIFHTNTGGNINNW